MKSCSCDSLLRFILKQTESNSDVTFSRKELVSVLPESFEKFKALRLLKYSQYDWETEPYYSSIPGDSGNERYIRKVNDRYMAFSAEDSSLGVVEVDEDDLHQYTFDMMQFFNQLKSKNDISGTIQDFLNGCFYLGFKQYGNHRVEFIFVQDADTLSIAGIKSLSKEHKSVIITPINKLGKLDIAGRGIINITLTDSLNDDFVLDIDLRLLDIADDGLTDQQRRDYEQFGYKCYDKIRIPDQEPNYRTYTIFVNDKSVRLGESLFKLLLRFIKELKKCQGGWVSVYDLYDEHLINDPEKYHKYSDLRKVLEGSSISGNGKDLIESDGSKNYRLSVHPDFCC